MLVCGTVLGRRYQIERWLGAGGMGSTFLAQDLVGGDEVALKVVRVASPELLREFRDEFARLRGLYHPRLVRVHDFGTAPVTAPPDAAQAPPSPVHYYTAQFVQGVSLDVFGRGAAWPAVREVVVDALEALRLLHELGIRHGDFKPSNILVDSTGRGTLIDLSCSRPIETRSPQSLAASGTPAFMAPELLDGRGADARADLYAVGVTLAELAGGCALPHPVQRLVARLRQPRPELRPADIAEVIELLGGTPAPPSVFGGLAPKVVGRQKELDHGSSRLDDLCAGREAPRCLCVTGPLGIGKSRVLQELRWEAELRGALTLECVRTSADPIASLLRLADAHGPGGGSLDSVLAAQAVLGGGARATVLVMDDVDALSERDQFLTLAMIRSLSPRGRLFVLCAARHPLDLDVKLASVETLPLEPLSQADLGVWSRGRVPDRRLRELHAFTGGNPAYVEWTLGRIANSELNAEALTVRSSPIRQSMPQARRSSSSSSTRQSASPAQDFALGELRRRFGAPEQQRVLGLLAALGGELDLQRWKASIPRPGLNWLLEQGWVIEAGSTIRLTRGADASVLAQVLPTEIVGAAHSEIADGLLPELHAQPSTLTQWGRALHHLALAGRVPEAEHLLGGLETDEPSERGDWISWLGTLAERSTDSSTLLKIAECWQLAGRARAALGILSGLRRRSREPGVLARVYAVGAECCLRLGKARAARRHARRLQRISAPEATGARIADICSRSLIQEGNYREAMAVSNIWISRELSNELKGRLHENVGVAATYLDDLQTARAELSAAAALQDRGATPRDVIRTLSYQGIVYFREGRLAASAAVHRRALDMAEHEELTDLIASASLNWASVCQQRGDLGQALSGYGRALEIGRALGRVNTVVRGEFNLASLYAEIGSFDRARDALLRTRRAVQDTQCHHLDGALALLEGELCLIEHDWDHAQASLNTAREVFVAQSAARDVAEVDLVLAALALDQRGVRGGEASLVRAQQSLARAEEALVELGASDLRIRMALVRARLSLATGEHAPAISALEGAVVMAQKSELVPLEAELEGALAVAFEMLGDRDASRAHRTRAQRVWDRIGASLSQSLADVFWRHPRRSALAESHPEARAAAAAVGPELARLLAINRRLNSTLSMSRVLDCTMDAAIDLTGVERGFVLLREEEGAGFRIVVARNMDQRRLADDDMQFSRGIAERVVQTEAPVLATDIGADERFRHHRSVHAMQLKSVACVPILAPCGILGAIYLDTRVARSRITEVHMPMLVAFAEQAALALTNAQLHLALEQRTQQLEAEKRNVSRLLRSQEREIRRLRSEVDTRQQLLEHRYGYEQIAGRGEAMQKVLAVLDRVIETDVTVLIEGESGTGKELVAKAIHFNSPRRSGPFVGINCGALPESLLESELFGHVRGAFSGATADKEGLFAAAKGGTLFLDELGEMSPALQVKLLRALQEKEVRAVGASVQTPFDARLVCATNRDLKAAVQAGSFREDLYYRVSVVDVTVPPLRERIEDIPDIAEAILARLAAPRGRSLTIAPDALRALAGYHWPGNVRQLENILTKSMVLLEGDVLRASDIVLPRAREPSRTTRRRVDYEHDEAERILAQLRTARWNVCRVSRALGIPRSTLYRKIRRYQLAPQPAGEEPKGRAKRKKK